MFSIRTQLQEVDFAVLKAGLKMCIVISYAVFVLRLQDVLESNKIFRFPIKRVKKILYVSNRRELSKDIL